MKPLFVGKILYTPDNAITRNITRGANATFEKAVQILDTIRVVVDTQKMLQDGTNGSDTLSKLRVSFNGTYIFVYKLFHVYRLLFQITTVRKGLLLFSN